MKKTTRPRKIKLQLKQETVRTLQLQELANVDGGLRRVNTAASNADVCCA